MTSLYSLRSTPVKGEFLITKFDRDYNPEGTYALTRSECSCPRSHKTGCRHRTMLPLFQQTNHINDGWFLDFHTRLWRKPLSEVMLSTADDTVEAGFEILRELIYGHRRLAKSFESEGSSLCAPAGPRQDHSKAEPNAERAPHLAPLEPPTPEVEQLSSPQPAPSPPPVGVGGLPSPAGSVKRRRVT